MDEKRILHLKGVQLQVYRQPVVQKRTALQLTHLSLRTDAEIRRHAEETAMNYVNP